MVLTIFVIVFFTGIFLYAIGKAIVSESNNIETKKRALKIKKETETAVRADVESKIETLTKEILELKGLSKTNSTGIESLTKEVLEFKELSKDIMTELETQSQASSDSQLEVKNVIVRELARKLTYPISISDASSIPNRGCSEITTKTKEKVVEILEFKELSRNKIGVPETQPQDSNYIVFAPTV